MKRFLLAAFTLLLAHAIFAQKSASGWQVSSGPHKIFIENQSQFDGRNKLPGSQILFGTENGSAQLLFTKNGLTYRYTKLEARKIDAEKEKKENEKGKEASDLSQREREEKTPIITSDWVQMQWENSNPDVEVQGLDKVSAYESFVVKGKNINNVPCYSKLLYKNLYPGIDVEYVFHEKEGIEYSLIIHPGADVSKVKMHYSHLPKINMNQAGDLHLPTKFGDIIDHAPVTYYANERNKVIASHFRVSGKDVTFSLDDYDNTQTVVIDPWTINPALNYLDADFQVESDSSGNVYVYGGGTPFQLMKYDATGAWQWTFNTSWDTSVWVGTLKTDPAGNSYITSGTTPIIDKVNTGGGLVWTNTGNSLSDEYWSLAFNCDYTQLMCGGTRLVGLFTFTGSGRMFNINLNNGSVISNAIVAYSVPGFIFTDPNEVRAMCSSPNGNYYYLTLDTFGGMNQSMVPLYGTVSNQQITYGSPSYTYTNSGQNVIRATENFVYTSDGASVYKRDINTGAVLTTVNNPTGSFTAGGFLAPGNSANNGGLDIDSCGNVYVGGGSQVNEFDANLVFITSAATPGAVYDVAVSTNGNILACGSGYTMSINMSACPMAAHICAAVTLQANTTQTNPPCAGQCTGTATATPSNGTGPYSYLWSAGGQTTQVATALCAGSYAVTITDQSSGSTATATAIITDPAAMNVTAGTSSATCGSSDGSDTATVNTGTGPFTYLWSNNGTDQIITGLSSGPYTVTVTGANGCTATATSTVNSSAGLTLAPTFTNTSCGSGNGSGSVNVTAGNGPFTYLWSNSSTAQTISNVVPGTYLVTVTGAGGCSATSSVTIAASSGITLSTSETDAGCSGGGSASVTVLSSNGSTTYLWTNGATDQIANNLSAGNYTVTVTDSTGCTATATAVVGSSGGALTLAPSETDASCGSNNGSASVTVTTGNAPFTYLWTTGATTSSLSNLAGGTYIVTVSGGGGCTATLSVVVNSTTAVTISSSETDATCGGVNGSASVTINTGSGPFTYLWNSSATTASLSNISGGTYTVTVTGAGGCSATASAIVAAGGGVTLASSSSNTNCGLNNGSAAANPSGTGPFTYIWSNGATTDSISSLAAGTYIVTVNDGSGCSATASLVVNPSGSGGVTINADKTQICADDSAQVCAPSGFASYYWNTGQNTQCIYTSSSGAYYVTVTDNGGCTATSNQLTINVYPNPPVSISVNGDTLRAYGATSYQWYLNGSPIPGDTTSMIIAQQNGNYSVGITDTNGCAATSSQQYIKLATDIINITGSEGVKVYPNPLMTGGWQVELEGQWLGGWSELYDAGGKLVYKSEIRNDKFEINVPLAQGIYLLRVFSGANSATLKLVKL